MYVTTVFVSGHIMASYIQAIMILVFLGSGIMDLIAALPSQHGAIPLQIQSKDVIYSPPTQNTIHQQPISEENSNSHTVFSSRGAF